MVNGLNRFRTHFAAYADRYALIGGAASSIAMEELGAEFRVTKDLDIVLCIEALDRDFVEAFWDFIKAGAYENRQKSTGKRLFYRFYAPSNPGYPEMLELFSRAPDALDLATHAQLTPIPIDEEVSSLSAILMDDSYYEFVMANRLTVHGLAVIPAWALIPLKAHAFLDLSERKARGEHVDSKNIKKHRNDIFRLFTTLPRDRVMKLPPTIQRDLRKAMLQMGEEQMDLKSFGLGKMPLSDALTQLSRIYDISS